MEISATYRGQAVTIVNIAGSGSSILVTYKDASNNLIVDRGISILAGSTSATIATSATGV